MGLPQLKYDTYTVDEYLTAEREGLERHEYADGYIYQMAGESGEHADICTNLTRLISNQLVGTPCRVRAKDTKVRSSPLVAPTSRKGLFSYPDLVVICGEPSYHDEHRDIIINPTVIIEVLSPSTEKFDRFGKFMRYRMWNPTLTDYILVWQHAPVVEQYTRQTDGSWRHRVYYRPAENLSIESINCALSMAAIFDRVEFTQTGADFLLLLPETDESDGDETETNH